jgi:hypothetical protein
MTAENSIPSPVVADVPPTFDLLPLTTEVRAAIDEMGWVTPTPVQLAAFGPASEGSDIVVQARTGTGKTAAFGLPLIDKRVRPEPQTQVLILAPTRELALQSAKELERIGRHRGIRTSAVYGGAPMERQVRELADGAQIVSGTPGRVLDHLRRGTLDPEHIRTSCSTRPTRCSRWASRRSSTRSSTSCRRTGRRCSSRRPRRPDPAPGRTACASRCSSRSRATRSAPRRSRTSSTSSVRPRQAPRPHPHPRGR